MERKQTFVELQEEIGKNSTYILTSLGETFGIHKLLRWLNDLLSKK